MRDRKGRGLKICMTVEAPGTYHRYPSSSHSSHPVGLRSQVPFVKNEKQKAF